MNRCSLLLMAGIICGIGQSGCTRSSSMENPMIEIGTIHSEEVIDIHDIMDIEYIPLETNDSSITHGNVQAVGKELIVAKNNGNDGDVFLFDRNTGKFLRKFNHLGQGPEDYTFINDIVLDEANKELFINDAIAKLILVYDYYGTFKRRIKIDNDTECLFMFDYDKDNLIRYDISGYYHHREKRGDRAFHALISKNDGSITRQIILPFDIINAPKVIEEDKVATFPIRTITPSQNGFILSDTSSDTIYYFNPPRNTLEPFMVKSSAMGEDNHIRFGIITQRYFFMDIIKMSYDFDTWRGFPASQVAYDKQEKRFNDVVVNNSDFVKGRSIDMTAHPVNNSSVAGFQAIQAHEIIDAYTKNELSGELKNLAPNLKEDDNVVVLIMKNKKE